MYSAPYFERLGEAYAVVDGIPDHQITLDIEQINVGPDMSSIGVQDGRYIEPTNWDGLILTPDIWLSLCPPYIDIVWPLLENRESYGVEVFWSIEGRLTGRYEIAMAHLFNLNHDVAEDLFGMRGDDETDNRSDKQVFLDRIAAFLRDNGQELTVGSGHVDQHEMLEHGISPSDSMTADPAGAFNPKKEAQAEKNAESTSGVQTGFAALALENDAPGAETFDTEASATAVTPIVQEQSVEQKPGE
jgi:hypothetical protein